MYFILSLNKIHYLCKKTYMNCINKPQASDMKAMLQGLLGSGFSIEQIATMTNKSIDEIRKYV